MGHGHLSASLWSWTFSLALATLSLWKLSDLALAAADARRKRKHASPAYKHGFTGLIGDTPLLELSSLSKATGCTILVRELLLVLLCRVVAQLLIELAMCTSMYLRRRKQSS